MVGINDGCRMDDIHFFVHLMKTDQIFIVIILGGIAVLADCTAKNHVSQRISGCLHLVSAINEMMRMLCRVYRIEHNRKITTGRIFHSGSDIKTTDRQTMLLIFYRTCSDGNVGEKILDISPVFRVKHFIGTGKTAFFDCANVHFTHGDQTLDHIRSFFRIWLGSNTFVAFAGCTWFVGVNTRN